MYAYISGTLEDICEESVVIDVGGIGYEIFVSQLLKTHLPSEGSILKLYTHLYLREEIQQLYGFLSKSEKEMFLMLLTVTGVGPKAAMAILSLLEVEDLKFAILSEDVKTINKANGVGAKTAQRIILDLKDKINLEDAMEEKIAKASTNLDETAIAKSEAAMALTALGYSNTEALKAIGKVENAMELSTEQLIKAALRKMF